MGLQSVPLSYSHISSGPCPGQPQSIAGYQPMAILITTYVFGSYCHFSMLSTVSVGGKLVTNRDGTCTKAGETSTVTPPCFPIFNISIKALKSTEVAYPIPNWSISKG